MFMCVVNLKSVNKLDLTWKQSFLILSIMTLSVMTLSIMTLSIIDTQHNDTHNNTDIIPN